MGLTTFIENETEFDTLIANESLVVVDCTAPWCGPCKQVAPLMDQLADEYGDQVKVYKLDVDTNMAVAKRFGIRSIPAVMYFKAGDLKNTLVGLKPYQEFSSILDQLL